MNKPCSNTAGKTANRETTDDTMAREHGEKDYNKQREKAQSTSFP